jgi:hypothetical protein
VSEAAILLTGALGVVIAAFVLRRTRHKHAASITVFVGLFLTLAGIAAGLLLLPVDDAPTNSLGAVGFVAPAPPRPGRGFAIGFGVKINGCSNPVDVSVVAAGTRDYWVDHPARRTDPVWSSFSLILPGVGLRDLQVGLSDNAGGLTTPTQASVSPTDARYIYHNPPVRKDGDTVISGWVAYWQQTLQPVVATFRAPWLVHRGLSTCYLRLPELSGSPTVIAAEAALTPRQLREYGVDARTVVHSGSTTGSYAPALEITHGTSMVAVTSGEVMSDSSLPPPSALSYGDPAWTCRSLAASATSLPAGGKRDLPDILLGRRGTGAGFSEQVIERAAAGDCRAVAAIAEDSAAYSRDLVLLAVGAVTSLGITLLVQKLLDWMDSIGVQRSPQSTASRRPPGGRRRRRRERVRDPRGPREAGQEPSPPEERISPSGNDQVPPGEGTA